VFDEDNYSENGAGDPSAEMRTFEELPDVLDVTTAVGDADDDAAAIAEDLDDDEIIALETDSDATDIEDEELEPRMADAFDEEDEDVLDVAGDNDLDEGMDAASADEVEIRFIPNGDGVTNEEEAEVTDYEATGELSDEQVRELGYGMNRKDQDEAPSGSGASAEDVDDERHPRQEELLDEGVEETFPASDPVSVKRIT
ncbi:MAG: hypothetical protein ACXW3D_09080, partial [Caulobacteraceae bacterium]